MPSTFDRNAASFERHRAMPGSVLQAIRKTVWESTGLGPSARVLDLGAGSGRIGRVFVDADDAYVGVDFSLPMLREFRARSSTACLIQADGGRLPFPDACFDLVMLMQVLRGAHNWRDLLGETVRVVAPGGSVVVGHTVMPPDGIDARLKSQLSEILLKMGLTLDSSAQSRKESFEQLQAASGRSMQTTAASWAVTRTPREFLDRHSSGARFSKLPPEIQTEALRKLAGWAIKTCGSLDQVFSETHSFTLYIFGITHPDSREIRTG